MKKDTFSKVYSKNYFKMFGLIWSNLELFFSNIKKLRKDFGVAENLLVLDPAKCKNNFDNLTNFSEQKVKLFLKKNKNSLSQFYKELNKIRKKLNLGREWNTTLLRFTVSGILLPPPFSVFISENKDTGIIIFELNKSTTKYDLDLAWKNIENTRKKMYGKSRASFPTKKTIQNFNIYVESIIKKINNPYIEDSEGRKYKSTDMDIVGKLFPDKNNKKNTSGKEADKKRASKLRVNRHRFRKITN